MSYRMDTPDSILLDEIAHGNLEAFDQLYLRYAPRVEAFACCMLKDIDEARDVTQDIFLKIWEKRENAGEIRSIRNYLFRMTKNTIYNCFAQRSVEKKYEQSVNVIRDILSDEVSEKVSAKDLQMVISLAMGRMPEQRKKIFAMNRLNGLSYKDIAQRLGIKEKTVEYHMHLALSDLRKALSSLAIFSIFLNLN